MSKTQEVAIIVPVYNEATVIADVISNIETQGIVICVNDGSTDNSSLEISKTNSVVINHPINMGQGAALQTGLEYAIQFPSIKYFVTFDADGQHSLDDVLSMLKILKRENLDIILGSRFLGEAHNMRLSKKIMLKVAIRFTNFFSGVTLTDTHNGLRVFNRKFAESLNITMPDMAHASEIIDIIGSSKWKYKETPITISYTDYSMAKGQSIFNSINILFDLLMAKVGKR